MSMVQVKVLADRVQCTTHGISTNGNIKQSWIAVRNGQRITVECVVHPSLQNYQIDLIVDGVLRNGFNSRSRCVDKTSILFDTGIFKDGKSVFCGYLTASLLRPGPSKVPSAGESALGAIEVRLSTDNQGIEYKQMKPTCYEVEGWREFDNPWITNTDPIPDYEIKFTDEKLLSDKERNKFRWMISRPRAGQFPKSILRFLYRDQGSLQNAGVVSSIPNPLASHHTSPYTTSETSKPSEDLFFPILERQANLMPLSTEPVKPIKAMSSEEHQLSTSDRLIMSKSPSKLWAVQPESAYNAQGSMDEAKVSTGAPDTVTEELQTNTYCPLTAPAQRSPWSENQRSSSSESQSSMCTKSSCSGSLSDVEQVSPKRRKIDIKALEAEIAVLMKQAEESARRRKLASLARERYEKGLSEQYKALELRKLEVLNRIKLDREAEAADLKQLRDLGSEIC